MKLGQGVTPLVLGFQANDKIGTIQPYDDALVVTLRIGGYDVKRVSVDQGSAVEIMYPNLYKGLNLKPEDLTVYDSPLVSFEGKTITPRGQIRLPIQIGLDVVEVDFIVVDAYSPYTAIVARPWLHALEAVSSTLHQKVKYLSNGLKRFQRINPWLDSAWWLPSCIGPMRSPRPLLKGTYSNQEPQYCSTMNQRRKRSAKIQKKVVVSENPETFFQVSSQLPPQKRQNLIEFLRKHMAVFTWNAYEAPGVDSSFICHHLNVNPSVTLKKQPPRR